MYSMGVVIGVFLFHFPWQRQVFSSWLHRISLSLSWGSSFWEICLKFSKVKNVFVSWRFVDHAHSINQIILRRGNQTKLEIWFNWMIRPAHYLLNGSRDYFFWTYLDTIFIYNVLGPLPDLYILGGQARFAAPLVCTCAKTWKPHVGPRIRLTLSAWYIMLCTNITCLHCF